MRLFAAALLTSCIGLKATTSGPRHQIQRRGEDLQQQQQQCGAWMAQEETPKKVLGEGKRQKRGRGRAAKRLREQQGERFYANELTRLLHLERDEEEAQARDRLERSSPARLAAAGVALFELSAKRRRGNFYGRPVVRLEAEAMPAHKFAEGDLVALSSRSRPRVEGAVLKVGSRHIDVVVAADEAPAGRRWRLDQYYSSVSNDRAQAAIAAVAGGRGPPNDEIALELRRVIVHSYFGGDTAWLELARAPCAGLCRKAPSEASARSAVRAAGALLDPAQHRAATQALRQRVTLCQGPPGTGKTLVAAVVAAAAIRLRDSELSKRDLLAREWSRRKKRVLACAASNVATDNLLECLLSLGVNAVRVGNPASTRRSLRNHTLDAKVEALVRASSTSTRRADIAASVLAEADVVVASCVGSGSPFMVEYSRSPTPPFGLVVVDEAAQATEPSCLVPVAAAFGASQLVLVGDQMQLPPTVLSGRAHDEGLGLSLFARLAAAGLEPVLLTRQYRMHPAINAYSSSRFYASRVTTCPEVERERRSTRPPRGFDWPRPCDPIAFVAVDGRETPGTAGSILNPDEVAVVAATLDALLDAGDVAPDDVAILTPYAAQARAIADAIQHNPRVEVGTVDGLQGREKDFVLLSAVRANDRGAVGFLADFRRLNVALTRARRALIVLGDPLTLQHDATWAAFIRHCPHRSS